MRKSDEEHLVYSEWKNTEIVFEIAKKGGKTEVRFTHVGLKLAYEC
jgi:hypothetical protein